jgi:hypothetical protein
MSLNGTIIDLGAGQFGIECLSTDYNKPERIRHVWPIVALQTRGMSYCRNEEALGKPATISDGRVSCYLGNGNYVHGALPDLGQTKAIILEVSPMPKPRCRVETRWYGGRWQKLTRKGWRDV